MSRKTIAIARIILNIQLNHLIFVAGVVAAMGLLGVPNHYLFLWIVSVIVPLLMYYLRIKTKAIWAFFAGLISIFVLSLFLPMSILPKLFFSAMVFMYAMFSIRKKMTENPEQVELVSPAVFIVLIGAMTIKSHSYLPVCYGIAWAYLIGYFLHHFMLAYLKFVDINENSASNMPEKELFLHGVQQVGIFTGIVIVLSSLTSSTNWLAKMLSVIGEWVMAFLKYIFSGISGAIVEESAPPAPVVDTGDTEMFEPVEYSELWLRIQELLEWLYRIIIFVALVLILYYGTRAIIRFVKENFTKVGKQKEAKTILSNQDIRESCDAEVSKKEKHSFLDFLSHEQRIRTIYKKKVLREKARILGEAGPEGLAYLTAKECCDKIEAVDLKQAYEKVRYSSEKVTSEDVKRAKA